MTEALAALAIALALDALIGEPDRLWRRVPHPVVAFGGLIDRLDATFNRSSGRRAKGVAALAILVIVAGGVGFAILATPEPVATVLSVLGAAVLLAQRSLSDHVTAVADGLSRSLADGRQAVAMIVGRDPDALDESGVARAAIESAAENFSDGVVAPAFWFAVGGLPGILIYKAVNTGDSMIGHRTERHAAFGWATARLDDLMNLAPARLSGVLIAVAAASPHALKVMWRDARTHRSPNAGWPEAATAAALGIAVSGPRAYGGVFTDEPYVHAEGRKTLTPDDIRRAMALLWRAWGGGLALCVVGAIALA